MYAGSSAPIGAHRRSLAIVAKGWPATRSMTSPSRSVLAEVYLNGPPCGSCVAVVVSKKRRRSGGGAPGGSGSHPVAAR